MGSGASDLSNVVVPPTTWGDVATLGLTAGTVGTLGRCAQAGACGSPDGAQAATVADGAAQPAAPAVTQEMVQQWAVSASATMQLPASVPTVGPNPADNEWHMLAVGLPVWVWNSDAATQTQSTATNGITISFRGVRTDTTIDWGDGSSSTCTTMTPRPADADPMAQSPDCGHVYQRKGTFTITSSTAWSVTWNALGFDGNLTVPRSASTTLQVGELHAVITSRH